MLHKDCYEQNLAKVNSMRVKSAALEESPNGGTTAMKAGGV